MLSPCPDEMHFSATQKRRRERFRERKNMVLERLAGTTAASDEETRLRTRDIPC